MAVLFGGIGNDFMESLNLARWVIPLLICHVQPLMDLRYHNFCQNEASKKKRLFLFLEIFHIEQMHHFSELGKE